MKDATIQIRIEKQVKQELTEAGQEIGLSLSAFLVMSALRYAKELKQ